MIETAEGLANVAAIAAACDRVVAITVGAEDFALDLGIEPEADGLYVANMNLLAAARAARIVPIGYLGSVAQFSDREAFRAVARRGRALGFEGGFCVHPNQVDILNEEFSPGGSRRRRRGARAAGCLRGRPGGGDRRRDLPRQDGRRAGRGTRAGAGRPGRPDRPQGGAEAHGCRLRLSMDLRDWRYFVVIAECGLNLAASEQLHIAQPSLSIRIKALEQELGVELFERRPRGVALTNEGRELLTHARQILHAAETARESVRLRAKTAVGTVNFGVPTSLAARALRAC